MRGEYFCKGGDAMYAVLGATGHIGKRVADILLDMDETVRVVSRDIKRLKSCMMKGAIPFSGDMADEEFLESAFDGVTAVFSMIPPDVKTPNIRSFQNRISDSIVNAIKVTGVSHVVNLSSIGADLSGNTGPIAGLHDHEEKLNALYGTNVIHLRAAYFMENLFGNIFMIKQGFNGSALRGDLRMPLVATKDIAEAAAQYMLSRNFTGKSVKNLLGQRDLTMTEITRILGKTVGKELDYIQFPYEDAQSAMIESGFSEDAARSFVEMSRGLNDGTIYGRVMRTPESTTKTSIEDFALDFGRLYCKDNPECKASGL
jgi:uncharacterized protein YbjT (DUF2867 family)